MIQIKNIRKAELTTGGYVTKEATEFEEHQLAEKVYKLFLNRLGFICDLEVKKNE